MKLKKFLQFSFSIVLLYFAFRKINIFSLFNNLRDVPIILILISLIFNFILVIISGYRWSILLIKNPKIQDIFIFVKCIYLASFYGLFLPTSMASDLVKWFPLVKRYPDINKIKIAGSVLIDRVIGASAFFPVALIAAFVGKIIGFKFPDYLLLIFGVGCLLVLFFYFILFFVDFENVFNNLYYFNKIKKIMNLLKKENKIILFKALLVSIFLNIINVIPVWIVSLFLGVNFSLISVYVFIPMIGLILLLPISIAGLGAREQLYLFFFSQLGIEKEKILLVSTYQGIMIIAIALLSGIFLFSSRKK